ncbi:hypothetical protein BpHYR1_004838 [Brachionus plicatilis]|uniref:Uncharacterized protein n=1 Tax=Brachionus plicatilis TaxID=10195 RepID=A0A3M7QMI4_BRAPC|nr:hypothetical protein BpHYR1_004838 [Brachionus plicatilis]
MMGQNHAHFLYNLCALVLYKPSWFGFQHLYHHSGLLRSYNFDGCYFITGIKSHELFNPIGKITKNYIKFEKKIAPVLLIIQF